MTHDVLVIHGMMHFVPLAQCREEIVLSLVLLIVLCEYKADVLFLFAQI